MTDFKEHLPLAATQTFGRRQFMESAGKGLIAATVATDLLTSGTAGAQTTSSGNGPGPGPMFAAIKVEVPSQHAKSEGQQDSFPAILPKEKRVGYAIVGLGELTITQRCFCCLRKLETGSVGKR